MPAQIIDGKALAGRYRSHLKERCRRLAAAGVVPSLLAVLVGDDEGSRVYVGHKQRACDEVGVRSKVLTLPGDISQEDLIAAIQDEQAEFDGVIVQVPLPAHVDRFAVTNAINPEKDVDCFTSENLGLMMQGRPRFSPCTPEGILLLLRSIRCNPKGKHVVIVNRSLTVGQPLAVLLSQNKSYANATVTLCHEYTRDIVGVCRSADILVSAVGKRGEFLVTADMVKPGAAVIDVGISRLGGRITGDVDFDRVREVAGWITPVPGGVGPMTVFTLVKNTVTAASKFARQPAGVAR